MGTIQSKKQRKEMSEFIDWQKAKPYGLTKLQKLGTLCSRTHIFRRVSEIVRTLECRTSKGQTF